MLLCGILILVNAAIILGGCYFYFDGFFLRPSSLNNILFLEVPGVQLLAAFSVLASVRLRMRRKANPATDKISYWGISILS